MRELAKQCELVVVVGSKNSSNSNRLAELASRMGVKSKLIDDPNDVAADWFEVELKYGKDPEMRKLAENIINAQQAEIEQMQKWLKVHNKK